MIETVSFVLPSDRWFADFLARCQVLWATSHEYRVSLSRELSAARPNQSFGSALGPSFRKEVA